MQIKLLTPGTLIVTLVITIALHMVYYRAIRRRVPMSSLFKSFLSWVVCFLIAQFIWALVLSSAIFDSVWMSTQLPE